MELSKNEEKLVNLLCNLPYKKRNNDVPNWRENLIVCVMLTAIEENSVDNVISFIEENPDYDFDKIVSYIFSENKVEIVDDD